MPDKKILVIEDNELNLKLVKNLLLLEKYTVLEAVNAESGLELARKEQPDLILMDIQLPGMDGLEATQILKHDDAMKNIPVVALTSYAMEGDEEKALAAGCNGYISKPIDTKGFKDIISQFFYKPMNEN